MYGEQPSAPARHAARLFHDAGARDVLELGAGHGRDALHFAREGFTVHATDLSPADLQQFRFGCTPTTSPNPDSLVRGSRTPHPTPTRTASRADPHLMFTWWSRGRGGQGALWGSGSACVDVS